MRISQIFAPAAFGGLEGVVAQLCLGLAQRGHEVTAIAVVEHGARPVPAFLGHLAASGVRVEVVRPRHRAYREEQRMIRNLLTSVRPGVAHTHGYHADVVLRPVAQGLGIPVLATFHGFTGGGAKNRLFEWLQCRSARKLDAAVAVSTPVADRLARAGVPRPRIRVICNAWAAPGAFLAPGEARAQLGIGSGDKVLGWIGRLSPEKGPDLALEALARADQSLTLSFLGTGRLETSLKARTTDLRLDSRVRWHGMVDDAWKYVLAFDAVCLSSHTEGTPMVLLEALAAGVPIVTTRVGGIPDVVSDAEAILVSPDDPDALARGMSEVVFGDQAARVAAGKERLSRDFAPSSWLDRYEAVYRELTRGKGEGGQ